MKQYALIFFGSDQYSAIVLSHLLTANSVQLAVVVTDKHNDPSPVEKLANAHNLKIAYYPDFDHHLITKDTLGLCASFDHLIPQEIIEKFGGHLYNLHPSLLPQYRNVSPVQYAIALGDTETGITLFRISPTIDDGEIIDQISEPIRNDDTTPTLTTRLFSLGADLFLRFLGSDLNGSAQPTDSKVGRSDPMGALIFTHRLTRNSGFIEWPALHRLLTNQPILPADTTNELLYLRLFRHPSTILSDLLRALTPWPGVWSLVPQPKADPPRADTRKGDLRISIVPDPNHVPSTTYYVLIAGKPLAISLSDFTKYYL